MIYTGKTFRLFLVYRNRLRDHRSQALGNIITTCYAQKYRLGYNNIVDNSSWYFYQMNVEAIASESAFLGQVGT